MLERDIILPFHFTEVGNLIFNLQFDKGLPRKQASWIIPEYGNMMSCSTLGRCPGSDGVSTLYTLYTETGDWLEETPLHQVFTNTEKVPTSTRAFSWLKVPNGAFTFKTLCYVCAKQVLAMVSRCKIGLLIKMDRRL